MGNKGQYRESNIGKEDCGGYRQDKHDSSTATIWLTYLVEVDVDTLKLELRVATVAIRMGLVSSIRVQNVTTTRVGGRDD